MLELCLRMAVDYVVCLCSFVWARWRVAVCGGVYRACVGGAYVVYQKSTGGSCTLEVCLVLIVTLQAVGGIELAELSVW
jgi:hypothetical protein